MSRYAARTQVSVQSSVAEIDQLIERFGAEQFTYTRSATRDEVAFVYRGKPVRMSVPRADAEQERRRIWRVMVLTVKALLVAVEEGVIRFEDAFLSYFVMPDGSTLGDALIPRLAALSERGELPVLSLPAGRP